VRSLEALPDAARAYVHTLQGLLPNRIVSLGTGPANRDLVEIGGR
jgi:adenylosuccinate synthase